MKRKYDELLGQNINDDGAENAAERGITKRFTMSKYEMKR